MKLKVTEQQIFNSILDWLTVMRIPHAKIRNTGLIIHKEGRTIFGRGNRDQRGVPDILCCYSGYPIAIEVKSETGRLSTEQYEWHENWRRAKGLVVVARNLQTVIDFFEKLN